MALLKAWPWGMTAATVPCNTEQYEQQQQQQLNPLQQQRQQHWEQQQQLNPLQQQQRQQHWEQQQLQESNPLQQQRQQQQQREQEQHVQHELEQQRHQQLPEAVKPPHPSNSSPGSHASRAAAASRGNALLEGARLLLLSALWLGSSSSVILANRHILVELAWPYPFAMSAMGMGVSGLFAFIYCDVLRLLPPAEVTLEFCVLRVLPIGALQAVVMWLSNSLYLLLTMAFIEMSRAAMPLFIMLALYLTNQETPTPAILTAVCLTALGGAAAAYGEIRLCAKGLVFLVLNCCFEAGRLVLMQVLLVGRDLPAMQGLKLIAPACFACLTTMSAVVEYPRMARDGALATAAANWPMFLVASCAGLCVNLASNFVIKAAGSTTLKVLAAMRGPLVIALGVFMFVEHVSLLQLAGYATALAGFVWYNCAKAQQAADRKVAAAEPPSDEEGEGGEGSVKQPLLQQA